MKQKVVSYKKLPAVVDQYLREHCDLVIFDKITKENYDTFCRELTDAIGLIGAELKIDDELLEHAPNLKVSATISVGYDNLDIPALSRRGILATNTPGVLNETTADTMFGLIIATARRFTELDSYVKSGQWKKPVGVRQFGLDVHHKTLGIIGMGGIGTAIAKRAHLGFDMNILYHNRNRNEEAEQLYKATYCSLDELLQQSDFVCLMTPLTPETEKLIGAKEFKLMKETAFFINGSRGRTVDEAALIEALRNKEIAGAGLDVFEEEPTPVDNPLLKMSNVLTLPHIGSATLQTRTDMCMFAAENVVAALKGERPPALINADIWL
ncbi:D-glycerate dehydrogenase [Bacillus sp. AGMB 02131]|uniref:D-glycerate dehydrogenase n=1 Tax=Peribacillus faecalis TaxID=2772559 RepID=A0A927CUW0_9BACI|nr:D-glycerate dehydrogenase [Peribacillus faecalis]MBD3108257.1 D-glycerate dehydrogenase [Peribacillus faecalis]